MTDPLVPPEVNLRGLPWMRLDTTRLLDSDLFAMSNGDEFKAAVALWCKSWTQQPAASLPTEDRVLAHLSGAGAKWKKVKAMALRGWILADDGRLYHPVVAEQALAAWAERLEFRGEVDAEAERQRRHREERAALFKQLKDAGQHLPWNTPIGRLRELVEAISEKPVTRPVTEPVTPATHLSRTHHGDSHGLDGTGRDSKSKEQEQLPPQLEKSLPAEPPENSSGGGCTPIEACTAMIRGGVPPTRINREDPRLHAACAAGATAAMFEATAREATADTPTKSPGWIYQAVHGRIADAAAAATTTITPGASSHAAHRRSLAERAAEAHRSADERDAANADR